MKRFMHSAILFALALAPLGGALAGPYEQSVIAYEREKYQEAVKWLEIAADKGDPLAQFKLGNWLGFAQALGEQPFTKYLPRDDVRAAKLLERSANQGLADAQALLAMAYQNGQGVGKDYVQAYKWFGLAALRFVPVPRVNFAIGRREQVATQMSQQQIAEALRLINEWEQKSAE